MNAHRLCSYLFAAALTLGIASYSYSNTPITIVPIDLGLTTHDIFNQQLTATGDVPITWSNLVSSVGSPAIPATMSSSGEFNWFAGGSARGPVGIGATYSWSATATNLSGADVGKLAITLKLVVPEPVTIATLGIAIACAAFVRRRAS